MGVLSSGLILSMGGDASAARRTPWIPLGGFRSFSLEISLPAVNAPAGTLSIETSNNGTAATGKPIPGIELVGLTQPSGGAWACLLDSVHTDALYIAIVYTPSSGGFGAYFSDGAGATSGPRLVMKGEFDSSLGSASTTDLRTVHILFSSPSDDSALNISAWTLSALSDPPFALPTVQAVEDVLGDGSAFDLYLSFELSPGGTYRLTYGGEYIDFAAPALPVVAGRAFKLIDWIPDKNLREDDSGDLRNFVSVIDENIAILLNDVDQFGNIQDPDVAAERFVDQMLADLGNPFTEAPIGLAKKRLLVKTLIPMYKAIGTAAGLVNVIWFFLGFQASLTIVNRQGMRLGVSLLTVDWILGCGPDKWRMILKVATPANRALTNPEKRALNQMVTTMKYAHESIDIQTTLPSPVGVSAAASSSPVGITVSWSAVASATSYAVYMASVTGVTTQNGSRWPVSGTSLTLPMLAGKHRYFVVTAINAQGEGLSSTEVNAISG